MTTIEKNRIIAEFMGAVATYKPYVNEEETEYDMFGVIECIEDGENEKHYFLPKEMLFNSDWNWGMSVVEKIESLGFITSIYHLPKTLNTVKIIRGGNDIIGINGQTKIEAVYNACFEFIQWYNQNK